MSPIAAYVQPTLRRAGGFALIGTLAVAAPVLGQAAFAPFAGVGIIAAFLITDGPIFELFARPGDRQDGRLNGLAGFALAAAGLAILSTELGLPVSLFVASVLILAYGNLGKRIIAETSDEPFVGTAGFVVTGTFAGVGGQFATATVIGAQPAIPRYVFLATAGALVAALLREMLFERDDPLVMLASGLLLWLFAYLGSDVNPVELSAALAVTAALGFVSYALGTASVAGMLSGVLLSLLVIVLGGFGWFAVVISFFSIGALSTKYKYDEKKKRGIAEENEGARGTENVLGNAAIALLCVICFAASELIPVDPVLFQYAFAGSIAAALSDTLSSELGGLYDNPRLITTLTPVPPGTDGGVTWQGEVFGILGGLIIGIVSFALFPSVGATGSIAIGLAGFLGMTADSILGATIEGDNIGNETVNLAATFIGAILSVGSAITLL
ncbi:MAG: putative membrane protein [Haloquadratum walsbyi J07HQW2]|uniref:Putative membrane protein n=1 Tax=Haloquadratum walsbyi J07HQW2 TaxID=1238425 RepID=U1PT46_9EURY|nr:MAG: putative membrane protein [Haloquadratum walsbyi J07HQW2]